MKKPVLVMGFGAVVLGCPSTVTNNYMTCGEGTRLDPETNACVAVVKDASTDESEPNDAPQSMDVEQESETTVVDARPAPDPRDDTCVPGRKYISNGDKACGEYNPAGVCSETEPNTIVLEPLDLTDLRPQDDPWKPSTGGVWVRTPSHPGTNPACGTGCSRPGTVARIRIPIRHTSDVGFIMLYTRHEDETNSNAPWFITEDRLDEFCASEWQRDCWASGVRRSDIVIETTDPDAPAREFHLFYYPNETGGCDVWK